MNDETQALTDAEPLEEETIDQARKLVQLADLPPGSLNTAVSLLEDMVAEVDRLRDTVDQAGRVTERITQRWENADAEITRLRAQVVNLRRAYGHACTQRDKYMRRTAEWRSAALNGHDIPEDKDNDDE